MVSEVYEDPRASYDWISVMEHILVIDDERSMLEFLELLLRKEGYQVTLLEDGRKVDPDVPFIFITAFASAPTAIEALKLGAFDYITKPFQVNDFKNLVREALQARRWKKRAGTPQLQDQQRFQLVGISPPMLEIYKLVGTISTTDSTVLISGESGTGKELVAMAIHRASPRANTPFVSVNCGALPETLLESELFGYTRGAFTGALKDKKGLFEKAHGGTLFLDEIADMSPPMQVKLLRALQNKQILRVGGTEEVLIDTRVVEATNWDVEKRGRDRRLSRGSLLSTGSHSHSNSSVEREKGRYHSPGAPFYPEAQSSTWSRDPGHLQRSARVHGSL